MNPILKEESLFGEIACRNRFVTREQLQECVSLQKSEGKGRLLGTIMVEKGCITREDLRTILEIQKRHMETPVKGPQEKKADINFGVLLVKLNYLTENQVFGGIKKQAFYARKGLFFRLGEILVNEGVLKLDQVAQILAYQKKQVLECPSCGKQSSANIDDPNSQICAACQTRLRVPEKVDLIGAENISEVRESLLSPKIIKNRFKIIQKLGTGESKVFLAEDYLQNNLNIALKILNVNSEKEEQVNPIRSAVEQISTFNCPQLLKLFDFGVYSDSRTNPPSLHYFLTMEYLKGEPILEGTQSLSLEDRVLVLIQILKGMEYLHKKNRLHLNLKSSNVLLLSRTTQTLKILDFNLNPQEIPLNNYSAPELFRGEFPSVASDIFSLGCLFYHILSGTEPFRFGQLKETTEILPKPIEAGESSSLINPILERMLAWDPLKRYQSVWKLRPDIERLCDPALIIETAVLRKKGLDSIFASRHKILNQIKNILNLHFYAHQQNLLPASNSAEESFFIQITSEPGNGISHLLRHIAEFAEDLGVYCFRSYSYGALQQPLEPFIQIFREITHLVQTAGQLHHIKEKVLKITTELLKEFGYFQSLRGEFKLSEHPDIKEMICTSLLQLNEIFPFMITIEEIHSSDEATLDCLDMLLKQVEVQNKAQKKTKEKEGLLILISYDLKQLPAHFNTILLRWDTATGVLRLMLDPLNDKQITQILKALLPTFSHHEELFKLTGSSFFYLFEFIRFFWDSPVPMFSIPETHESLTKRRLAELGPVERECLAWMSFYQKPISQRELFFFAKKSKRSEIKQALKNLENFGLIQHLRWNPESYQIRHQKHIEYFLLYVHDPEVYHQTILDWIRSQTKGVLLSRIEELLWHARQCASLKRIFDYLCLASYKARKTGNDYQAIQLLEHALDQVSEISVPDISKEHYKNYIYSNLGELYSSIDQAEKAIKSYQKIKFDLFPSENKRGIVERKLAQAHLALNEFNKAEWMIKLSFKHLSHPEEKAYASLLMVPIEVNRGHYKAAQEYCKEAETLFHSLSVSDEIHKPLVLYWLAYTAYHQGQFVEALESASEAFQQAQNLHSDDWMIKSLHAMAQANLALGRYEQASRQIEKALSLAEKNNNRRALLASYLLLGETHFRTGNTQQSREKYRVALRYAEELDSPTLKFYSILGLTHAFTDQLEADARRYLIEELQSYSIHSSIRLQTRVSLALFHLHEPEDLKKQLQNLLEMLEKVQMLGDHELSWKLCYHIGIIYKELGDLKEAQNYFQKSWKIIQFQWAGLPNHFRQIYLKDIDRQKVQQELLKISLNSSNKTELPSPPNEEPEN
ncbi:MAG: tetratricopeptide repeat protein [Planctomycetota bacterium]